MGQYAAQCMCNKADDYGTDMHFELFAHITRFFGYKVSESKEEGKKVKERYYYT